MALENYAHDRLQVSRRVILSNLAEGLIREAEAIFDNDELSEPRDRGADKGRMESHTLSELKLASLGLKHSLRTLHALRSFKGSTLTVNRYSPDSVGRMHQDQGIMLPIAILQLAPGQFEFTETYNPENDGQDDFDAVTISVDQGDLLWLTTPDLFHRRTNSTKYTAFSLVVSRPLPLFEMTAETPQLDKLLTDEAA